MKTLDDIKRELFGRKPLLETPVVRLVSSAIVASAGGVLIAGCHCVGDSDGDGIPDCYDHEECDGVDNNGDGQVDEGFDLNGNGVPDCEEGDTTHEYVYYGGKCGNIGDGNTEDATPSAVLSAYLSSYWPVTLEFNQVPGENSIPANRGFAHTFSGLPTGILAASLELTMKPTAHSSGGLAYNDSLALDYTGAGAAWGISIQNLPGGNPWNQNGAPVTFNLDLDNLPNGGQSILTSMGDGALDIWVQDDSGVDCAILRVKAGQVAEDKCDGQDNDNDGLIDEGWPDSDGDGIADCVDKVSDERCDGIDNNQNGLVDEGYPDSDGDGIADCVDRDPEREPCDGIDNNQDGQVDEGHPDSDGDGLADCVDEDPIESCDGEDNDGDGLIDEGFSDFDQDGIADCIDEDPRELCNGLDDDLDGSVDEGWPDADADGIADCVDEEPNETCDGKDNDGDGLVDEGWPDYDQDGIADCIDKDPKELCNGKDDDGDGGIDEGWPDSDADGLADCVDKDPYELCDGKDNDGDGQVDEGWSDYDQDGIADCVDRDPKELCNGKDDDGDGSIDEGWPDSDQDGIADCIDDIGILYGGSCDKLNPEIERTSVSQEVLDFVDQYWPGQYPLMFDQMPGESTGVSANRPFAHTFTGLPANICGAKLSITMRPTADSSGGLAYNDSIALEYLNPTWAWGAYIINLPEAAGSWSQGDPLTTFTLNLSALPTSSGTMSLLGATTDGDLDVYTQDDTGVDCAILKFKTRCDTTGSTTGDPLPAETPSPETPVPGK